MAVVLAMISSLLCPTYPINIQVWQIKIPWNAMKIHHFWYLNPIKSSLLMVISHDIPFFCHRLVLTQCFVIWIWSNPGHHLPRHTCTHPSIYYMHICIYTYTCSCVWHIYIYIYICIHTHIIYICAYVCIYIVYIYICICICICICIHIYVYIHILYIYAYVCMYI